MSEIVDWVSVCRLEDIVADMGVCVSVNKEQIAVFKESRDNKVFAISNFDPNSKANVLSRGILGSVGDRLVVASPLYKQHFCLESGECLETGEAIKTYPVRINNGDVQLAIA